MFKGKPKGLVCDICNGEFFERSFPIHRKQCEQLFQEQTDHCKFCDRRVDKHGFKSHSEQCKLRFKGQTFAARKQAQEKRREEARQALAKQEEAKREAMANLSAEGGGEGGGEGELVQCAYCGRKFVAARIQTHEDICRENEERRAKREARQKELAARSSRKPR